MCSMADQTILKHIYIENKTVENDWSKLCTPIYISSDHRWSPKVSKKKKKQWNIWCSQFGVKIFSLKQHTDCILLMRHNDNELWFNLIIVCSEIVGFFEFDKVSINVRHSFIIRTFLSISLSILLQNVKWGKWTRLMHVTTSLM